MGHLTIGEVARRAGVNASALRYYERIGLLPEAPRVNGQRRYSSDALTRLGLIRMAQEAGFSLDDIRTLITGYPEDIPPGERWQDIAQRKLPEVDALTRRMQAVRQVLEESLECDCLTLDACAGLGWTTTPPEGQAQTTAP